MGDDLRGALRVRQDADGYALVGFDLRRLAAAAGSDDGLVVSLPAFVDGVPVVRVTAEAFTRRLVQGVGVRLLAMPDTVQIVGANAFLALSVQHIHVGAGVRVLGEQPCDLAGVSPRLKRREYSVDARNGRFCARDGNLFADGGSYAVVFSLAVRRAHRASRGCRAHRRAPRSPPVRTSFGGVVPADACARGCEGLGRCRVAVPARSAGASPARRSRRAAGGSASGGA